MDYNLNDREIVLIRLQAANGSYAEISNYGATLVSWYVPDKTGELENIILSYHKIEDYFSDAFYLGATVGRFANRISRAQFDLNGTTYYLDKNDGNNSNHGGFNGFNSRIFDYEMRGNQLLLSCQSPDGEGGFPGNIQVSVIYSLSDENELSIEYQAISDQTTLFNPTNHAYFNLSGKAGTILDHELKVYADYYLQSNDEFLPTGTIRPLSDPAFDFRAYRKIADLMPLKKEILPGYNTYFIARSSEKTLKRLASLRESQSGRCLDVYSSMPGVQIYTGDYLSYPFHAFAGIALEAQFYPDAPNHSHFLPAVLYRDEQIRHTIQYKLR
ncbi:MAG: galactose mutarotase [Dysgonamonadaceae bacterium]|nr:galactose mutarotase [Dysgonamonadaceae bacterium]